MQNLTYKSEFIPEVLISIVLSDNPNYEKLEPIFKELGYGFMVPNQNLIIIDGEQLINNFDSDVLKFIEAHEVSHILLNHSGPRNEKEELEADLGAYVILKHYGHKKPLELLLKHFEDRHGMEFDESMIPEISNKLGLG